MTISQTLETSRYLSLKKACIFLFTIFSFFFFYDLSKMKCCRVLIINIIPTEHLFCFYCNCFSFFFLKEATNIFLFPSRFSFRRYTSTYLSPRNKDSSCHPTLNPLPPSDAVRQQKKIFLKIFSVQ